MGVLRKKFFLLTVLFIGLIAVSANIVEAATFVVNTTNDTQDATPGNGICADSGGACSLRAAISEANALAGADVITLPAGIYTITLTGTDENANASGDFDLNSEITINGAGSGTTIVQGAASRGVATERVFHLRTSNTMIINDLTVRYGRYTAAAAAGTFGAGVRIDAAAVVATLNNVVVTENDNGRRGGGIAVSGTTAGARLTLNNCTVSDNTASGILTTSSFGAGVYGDTADATININNSLITGNTVSNTSTTFEAVAGGIYWSHGTLNITDSTISNNTATSSGANAFSGGVLIFRAMTTITGSTITGNIARVTGGTGSASTGGVFNQEATVSILNSVISNNTVSNTVTPRKATDAGVRVSADSNPAFMDITNTTVSGNTAYDSGGGVVNSSSSANSTVNIISSTISGNSATGATSVGGGLLNFRSYTTSTGQAAMNVLNSTVSGNSAATGAGSYNIGTNATINFNFSTIASNTAATLGGGAYQGLLGGATVIKNSIIADNTAPTGPDISGPILSLNYNHVENTSGGTFPFAFLPGDVTGTDPMLGALANNGGTTLTHLPDVSSPVTNAIPNFLNDCGFPLSTSQNGNARPQQTGCEKGAAERLAPLSAAASIEGRVIAADGTGIRNAVIVVSGGSLSAPMLIRTGTFGYYRVEALEAGETYVLTINSKRFVFTNPSRVITLNKSVSVIDFIAEP